MDGYNGEPGDKGVRGDDCGYCPPGVPGIKVSSFFYLKIILHFLITMTFREKEVKVVVEVSRAYKVTFFAFLSLTQN